MLAENKDERLRRVAFATLVAQSHPPPGWSTERLGRLARYRPDKVPLVAAAAQFTLPPTENEGVAIN